MGKLLGLFFGFLVFGPVGSLVGLIFGFVFDANIKTFTYNIFNEDSFNDNTLIIKAFPLLCADVVLSSDFDRSSILIVKNLSIELFGKKAASHIMEEFKNYIENGYSESRLNSVCEELRYKLDSNTRVNLINLLFTIIKNRGLYSKAEVDALKKIGENLGVNINPFGGSSGQSDRFYGSYENYYQDSYNRQNSYREQSKDYYKILELSKSATDDEIKKQYRTLCKKYHPDIVNHLPENERKASEEKMKEIIDAYEEVKKERGIK